MAGKTPLLATIAAWAGKLLLIGLVGVCVLGAGVILLRLAWFFYPAGIAVVTAGIFLAFLFKRSKLPPVTFLGQLAFVVWGPVYVAGATMPLRASGALFVPSPSLAWFDVGIAAAGTLVALVVTARDAAWRRRQLVQLENLPTSKVAAAAAGLVELRGVARAATGTSRPGDVLIPKVLQPFAVEDETGRVKVDPTGARFRDLLAHVFGGGACEVKLPEYTLKDGDPVYVIGSLEEGARGERVVRPRVEAKTGFLWRTLFTFKEKGTLPQRDLQHVFFVSTQDERAARRHILNGLRQILVLGGVWLVFAAILTVIQLPRALSIDAWSVEEIAQHAPRERRGELLHRRMKIGERDDRLKVLEVAHPIVYKDSLPIFFQALGDPDAAIARMAADQLNPDSYETWTQLHLKAAPYHHAAMDGVRRGLRSPDAKVRRISVLCGGRISPQTAAADLAPLLKDARPEIRKAAAQSLGEVGKPAIGARDDLRAAFADADADVNRAVAAALRRILYEDPCYTSVFLEHLSSSDPVVRAESADALTRDDPDAVGPLIRLLDDPVPDVRRAAAYALQWLGSAKSEATPALMRAAKDPDADVRAVAIEALSSTNVRPPPEEFVPLLVPALDDPGYRVRRAAARALRHAGPAAAPALPGLGRALQRDDHDLRRYAGEVLVAMGPAAAAALPDLAKALESTDRNIRWDAMRIVASLGAVAEPLAEALGRALSDPNVRGEAIKALGKLGPSGRAGVPALAALLAEDAGHRWNLLDALESIGPAASEAVPAILGVIDANDTYVDEAIRTLGRIGPGARSAVPRLIPLVGSGRQSMVRVALRAIGPGDASALADLRARFDASSGWLRKVYGELLCIYGEDVADLFPHLLTLMEDGYDGSFAAAVANGGRPALVALSDWLRETLPRRRRIACDILKRMGPKAAPAVDAVADLLKDPDHDLRTQACEILTAIGPAAAPATDRLVALVRDENLATKAIEALEAIGPAAAPAAPALLGVPGTDRALRAILQLPKDGGLQRGAIKALRQEPAGGDRACLLGRIAMSTHDGPTCKEALAALAAWTRMPEKAAPLILLGLRHQSPDVKEAVFRALRDVDPTGHTVLLASGNLLSRGNSWQDGREALKVVLAAGPAAVDILPNLLPALHSGHRDQWGRAAEAIGRIGPAARSAERPLLNFLQGATGEDAARAALALARIGADDQVLPTIAAKARESRGREKEIFEAAAARIGATASPDADPWPRERAVFAAKTIGELRSALKDAHPAVRHAAAQRIEELEAGAAEAVPELTGALDDSSLAVRVLAARSLGHLRAAAAPAVMPLGRALADPDRELAVAAAYALGGVGPAARRVFAEVLAAYRKGLREAAMPLTAIGPEAAEAVPDLMKNLREPRTDELFALGAIGPAAKPAVPAVIACLDHRDGFVRNAAYQALRGIGPSAAEAIPVLLERLGRTPPGTIDPARQALGGIGEAAVPGLIEVLRTGRSQAKISAAWTLREIGPKAKAAVPVLIETLKKKEAWLLHPAIGALSGIGPDAAEAAPLLAPLTKQQNEIGYAAIEALRKLRASR